MKMTSTIQLHNIDGPTEFFSFKYCDDMIVVMDLDCTNSPLVLHTASELNYFNGTRKWLFIGNEDLNVSISLMKTTNINIDSKIFLLRPNENDFELYKITSPSLRRSNILKVDLIAKYSMMEGVLTYEDSYDKDKFKRKDLEGIRLKVAIAVRFFF